MEIHQIDQNNWGVCGFVSATQAALKNGTGNVSLKGTTYDTLFPIIKQFCSKNGNALQKELLDFSGVFGSDYQYGSIDDVLRGMEGDHALNRAVGLAMTAKAMSVLCRDLGFTNCNFQGTTSTTSALDFKYKNAIYGLGRQGAKGNYRFGLLHWVYVDPAGSIMSWGDFRVMSDLQAQGYNKITHLLSGLK